MLDRLAAIYLAVSRAFVRACALAALAAMVVVQASEIVWRAATARGLIWVHELSIMLAMVVYFLAYALIAKERGYIKVEALYRRFTPSLQSRIDIGTRVVIIGFHLLLCYLTISIFGFVRAFTTPVLDLPETVYYVPLALGTADIVLTELIYLWRRLTGREAALSRRAELLT
jgi:TRAP-type C4-dicarboxylate transport system permease small subunit